MLGIYKFTLVTCTLDLGLLRLPLTGRFKAMEHLSGKDGAKNPRLEKKLRARARVCVCYRYTCTYTYDLNHIFWLKL